MRNRKICISIWEIVMIWIIEFLVVSIEEKIFESLL